MINTELKYLCWIAVQKLNRCYSIVILETILRKTNKRCVINRIICVGKEYLKPFNFEQTIAILYCVQTNKLYLFFLNKITD